MRFSIWPSTAQTWEDFHDAAAHAAQTGWDGVWAADHFMPSTSSVDRPMLECFTLLSAIAATVPRLRIGSLVAGNTYRHPAVLANMVATLDRVSGGRVVLGLGAGWQENEHVAYGIDYYDVPFRLARLDEACAVVRHLLDEERSDFKGRFYTLTDAPLEPKPVQQHLPLLVGGGGEQVTLRIAARWADEWNTWGHPDVLAAKGAVLERHCESVGRDPAQIARSAQVLVDLEGGAQVYDMPYRRAYPTASGSAAELQDVLRAYEEANVGEFICPTGTSVRATPGATRWIDSWRRWPRPSGHVDRIGAPMGMVVRVRRIEPGEGFAPCRAAERNGGCAERVCVELRR